VKKTNDGRESNLERACKVRRPQITAGIPINRGNGILRCLVCRAGNEEMRRQCYGAKQIPAKFWALKQWLWPLCMTIGCVFLNIAYNSLKREEFVAPLPQILHSTGAKISKPLWRFVFLCSECWDVKADSPWARDAFGSCLCIKLCLNRDHVRCSLKMFILKCSAFSFWKKTIWWFFFFFCVFRCLFWSIFGHLISKNGRCFIGMVLVFWWFY